MNASLPVSFLAEPPPHGGPDARGPARWDFSTNSNACGPCPEALAAVQQADASRYPDPSYTALRTVLAEFHQVRPERIVLAASASEFIWRITTLAARCGATAVSLPTHSYGDYAQAARAWGLSIHHRPTHWTNSTDIHTTTADLHWMCEPSSPQGLTDPMLQTAQPLSGRWWVLDCAYRPLQLHCPPPPAPMDHLWQLWTPNKALGLTGVRAAYAIAPLHSAEDAARLIALAPSWPVGAHGVALLHAWAQPTTQHWLASSLITLRHWKKSQQTLCATLGWQIEPGSRANYFVARPPTHTLHTALTHLRAQDVQLRDCTSFGLPGWLRLGVLPPQAQQALHQAWLNMQPVPHPT
ncbi:MULTISPECIES: aminotransferase class I/II-fold pyridoxal phosphate-dependent enzyme [Giesbergeria]|uniref:histidinol-phosphate transaminase n=1 Tax=Giesbergeria sinuosa TaxID=80883 RepID=A0ABV9QB13_9BURK